MRPTKEEVFMDIAIQWSRLSTCSSRVAVGCVIVNKLGQIISSGYNGSPRHFDHCDDIGCDFDELGHCKRAIHAEMNAILQCAMTGVSCKDATLYVTHSCCSKCALMIAQSGIKNVIYRYQYQSISASAQILAIAKIPFIEEVKENSWKNDDTIGKNV